MSACDLSLECGGLEVDPTERYQVNHNTELRIDLQICRLFFFFTVSVMASAIQNVNTISNTLAGVDVEVYYRFYCYRGNQ